MAVSRGAEWVADYVAAWQSNDPNLIGALFTDDAVYLTSPDSEPRVGRDEIVAGWLDDLDEPGTWAFDWRIIHERDDLLLIQGRTIYPAATDFINLWIIRLADDGRAREFTEWYMRREHQD
ncbi:ketosteroid isomerase-like protein [Agromyces terreus]|uniref:Ketosteroid isomerase-like protein n=1 Tax=Agromyces terreus TaxID=424795 RepID=A0A9X2GVR8_9MICO|nr:nuclear transport factor 2 family protein [Agromyces terreus]MCP2369517.1 ketosteroid isomerase-like protein [Agromyces terreus]